MVEIKQRWIPTSNKNVRPGIKRKPTYITIHETDNTSVGANAVAHARLQASGNSRQASWHYQVDDKEIWQSVPDDEVAWHAGDGQGPGNMKSIGVEICVNRDGNYEQAKQNAAWLVRQLMKKHNIQINNVVQHHHWSGKNCPRIMREQNGWSAFLQMVQSSGGITVTTRILKLTSPYMQGEEVKKVQQKLGVAVDGIYGKETEAAVKAFQKANGLDVDGIVGEKTWAALFPPVMYDLSYVKGNQLTGIISSTSGKKIAEKVEWAVGATANCVLLKKRGYDLRGLQKILNELYPDSK
jgi:N-acetylmuramoyl-L-alanine amidase